MQVLSRPGGPHGKSSMPDSAMVSVHNDKYTIFHIAPHHCIALLRHIATGQGGGGTMVVGRAIGEEATKTRQA